MNTSPSIVAKNCYAALSSAKWPNVSNYPSGPAIDLVKSHFGRIRGFSRGITAQSPEDAQGMVVGFLAFGGALAGQLSHFEDEDLSDDIIAAADDMFLNDPITCIAELELWYPMFEEQLARAEEVDFDRGVGVGLLSLHLMIKTKLGDAFTVDSAVDVRSNPMAPEIAPQLQDILPPAEPAPLTEESLPAESERSSDDLIIKLADLSALGNVFFRFTLGENRNSLLEISFAGDIDLDTLTTVQDMFTGCRLKSENDVISIVTPNF